MLKHESKTYWWLFCFSIVSCSELRPTDAVTQDVPCGNGVLNSEEACDDGNLADGDGCDRACKKESGQTCLFPEECATQICARDRCQPKNMCGNTERESPESCDDGNIEAGDGCSPRCKLEDGESCGSANDCDSGSCEDDLCVAS